MSEPFDRQEFQAIAQHLKKGSFAPIFQQSNEKDHHLALKLMCIVDFHAQKWNLYERVAKAGNPKLLMQLIKFDSYGSFKYYDYQVGKGIGKRVLKCKFCDLVGPYGLILSHMAITHNAHIPLKTCAYCMRTDLKKHFDEDELHQCYEKYIERENIERDKIEMVCEIVTDFYGMLKALSDKFKTTTIRNHSFTGKGYTTVERLNRGYHDELGENVVVNTIRTPGMKAKNISGHLGAVDKEFKRVIQNLYGGNNLSRLVRRLADANSNGNGQAIIINDADENGEPNGGVATRSSTAASTAADIAAAVIAVQAQLSSVSDILSELKISTVYFGKAKNYFYDFPFFCNRIQNSTQNDNGKNDVTHSNQGNDAATTSTTAMNGVSVFIFQI